MRLASRAKSRFRICLRQVRMFSQLIGRVLWTGQLTRNPKFRRGSKSNCTPTGFRDPRFLLSAPNGDIFVVESRANQIKVLRDTNGDGKPDVTEIFAERSLNKPFGIAFYPPGDDPQFLYVGEY